jgi:hypothetical protein
VARVGTRGAAICALGCGPLNFARHRGFRPRPRIARLARAPDTPSSLLRAACPVPAAPRLTRHGRISVSAVQRARPALASNPPPDRPPPNDRRAADQPRSVPLGRTTRALPAACGAAPRLHLGPPWSAPRGGEGHHPCGETCGGSRPMGGGGTRRASLANYVATRRQARSAGRPAHGGRAMLGIACRGRLTQAPAVSD